MHPVTVQFPPASGQLIGEGGCLVWHSSYETSGSASAQYSLWDGTTNSGDNLMTVTLSSGQSTRDFVHIHHMPFYKGLYWHLDSGAVKGNVVIQIDHNCRPYWEVEARKLQAEYEALTQPPQPPREAPSSQTVSEIPNYFQPGPNIPRQ